jgi:2-polyprenyl-3-methyl-5-hydroxy-6-metoxy-1,4-benzoquinol methylase
MYCCSPDGTGKYFSDQAERYAKRYRKKGLDSTSDRLLRGLAYLGIESCTVLDIGCGIGALHLRMLKLGATSAVGVELSEGMLEQAQRLAEEMGIPGRVKYKRGDFVALDGEIEPADIVILDRVICCYAHPELLIEASAGKCNGLYAVSYPRDNVFGKFSFKSMAWLGELFRWSFHPYYHDPVQLEMRFQRLGLRGVFTDETPVWRIRIFRK